MKQPRLNHRWRYGLIAFALTILGISGCQSVGQPMARMMGMVPMGSDQDIADADHLWSELKRAQLVGPRAQQGAPYKGQPPHGAVLEMLTADVTVDGHRGLAIVKRNYGGPGVSEAAVARDRDRYLMAVTVMFKREAGYDEDDRNWFWAKYNPDGSLDTMNKMGMDIALAGRVAKGKAEGCISCHQGAPGGDFVFSDKIRVN